MVFLYKNISGNHVAQECNNNKDDLDTKPIEVSITVATPYAEIARRNSKKKQPTLLNATGSMRVRHNILSKFDRLEQQLVRPAIIPWVETGDPLTHFYQKEVIPTTADVMITKKKMYVKCNIFFLVSFVN